MNNTEKNHRAYVDEIVLLVQVNVIFMTGSLIEAINLLNNISLCILIINETFNFFFSKQIGLPLWTTANTTFSFK